MENNYVLLYARAACDESLSGSNKPIEEQFRELRVYAAEHGFTVAEEIGLACTTSQLGLEKIGSYLRSHPEVRIVVALSADRLFRTMVHYVSIEDLIEEFGIEIRLVKEGQILRTVANAQDRFAQGVFAMLAHNYIDNLREEIIKGQRTKAEAGRYPGRAPFGYQQVVDGKIVEHPVHADIVRQIYFRYASGKTSLRGLQSELEFWLGYRLSASKIMQILRNCFYAGKFLWRGEKYTGTHPRLISPSTYKRVQKLLARRTHCPRIDHVNSES